MQATWGLSYFRESESPQVGILFGAPRHIAGGLFLRSARLRRAQHAHERGRRTRVARAINVRVDRERARARGDDRDALARDLEPAARGAAQARRD